MTAPTPKSPFRPDCLRGRVALVTGGGSGICFEITRQLLAHGCHGVIICGRRASFLERAATILRETTTKSTAANVQYKVCDVREPEQCQAVVDFCRETFGRLDILVNGAAGNFLAPASNLSPKGFATVMAIDALGTFNMSRAAYSLLKETTTTTNNDDDNDDHCCDSSSVIINISATLQYGATFWQAHASAAKAAVDSLTRSLALEWGGSDDDARRIRVVGIAPGPIANTPGTTKLAPGQQQQSSSSSSSNDMMAEMVAERIPLGRMGETYEIAYAAIYLCCSNYVTGDTLVVDGGEWLYKEPLVPKEMVTELSRKVEAKSRAQAPRSSL